MLELGNNAHSILSNEYLALSLLKTCPQESNIGVFFHHNQFEQTLHQIQTDQLRQIIDLRRNCTPQLLLLKQYNFHLLSRILFWFMLWFSLGAIPGNLRTDSWLCTPGFLPTMLRSLLRKEPGLVAFKANTVSLDSGVFLGNVLMKTLPFPLLPAHTYLVRGRSWLKYKALPLDQPLYLVSGFADLVITIW